LPPVWSTADVGSFAQDTVKRRVPEILAGTRRRLGPVPAAVDAALDELDAELRGGRLRALREQTRDRAAWDAAVAPHLGRGWLQIPWYFAESYFYRRVLEATGFFGGALAGRDPYASHKAEEWVPQEGPRRAAELLASAPAQPLPRLEALIHGSLWGNRADLSYNVARELGAFMGGSDDLLVDDTAAVARHILATRGPVAIIADNAGTECLMDLALADHLLAVGVPGVELHLKDHPFFVSDTTVPDIGDALASLAGSGRAETVALGQRLRAHLDGGRVRLGTHPFYTSSGFFPALPQDLHAQLAGFALVVVKGDANYRRLCSDARWAPETPFAGVVADFPAPLVALRTMKAEVVVGLPAGVAERLTGEDPRWMVNGKRGLVQARL
jgi:hypothetical protein